MTPPRRRPVVSRVVPVLLILVALALTLGASPLGPRAVAAPVSRTEGDVGSWTIRALGGQRYAVAWRSPVRLPISSDRPTVRAVGASRVGAPTVAADGRTVRAVVTSPRTPTVAGLDVVLSGDRLDSRGRDGAVRAAGEVATGSPRRGPELGDDPGTPGPYPVVSSDYRRPSVKVPGMAEKIEMVGHVVEPALTADTGSRPLVLFLHGRHAYCYLAGDGEPNGDWPCRGGMKEVPSQLGYVYVQKQLASHGYTTVSIRVNGINAQDGDLADGGASARATIVRRHLEYWTTIATEHHTDLNRVVLVGHSRGGEGVDRASIRTAMSSPYRIVGQILVAPTNFAEQTAPYVPTVTLLPYCDGDVYDLQGQHYTDIARDISDAATGDTSLKSSVLVMGANHNFFNTEWTPGLSAAPSFDDWGGGPNEPCGRNTAGRLTATEQQAVGKAYISAAVAMFADRQQQFLPLFDGSGATVESLGDAVTYSHAVGGGRDVRRPAQLSLALAKGAETDFCVGVSEPGDYAPRACHTDDYQQITPHWPDASATVPKRSWFRMTWTKAGQTGGVLLDDPLDLRDRNLDLRTVVDPVRGDVKLRVRLTDSEGRSATLTPEGGEKIRTLLRGDFVTKLWAQAVRVDPSGAAIDLSQVVRVDLVGDSPDGTVEVADLASSPSRLPRVSDRRVPRLSIGSLTVPEGDRSGWNVARVPWTLSSAATRPSSFVVVTTGSQGGTHRFTVDVAPGQRSGTIPVGYLGDTIDDLPRQSTEITAWPGPGLMTDSYHGKLVVTDDDPTPAVYVGHGTGRVREGGSARFRVRLAAAVDYYVDIEATAVDGPGHEVTGMDVAKSWFDARCFGDRRKTLAQLHCGWYVSASPGETVRTFTVPIVRDGRKEGNETLTLRFRVLGKTKTTSVTVVRSS